MPMLFFFPFFLFLRPVSYTHLISDLAGEETIGRTQIAEALAYRTLDQKYWYEDVYKRQIFSASKRTAAG